MEKQQSKSWEQYADNTGFVERGYPFNEGFPDGFYGDGKVYELRLRDGRHARATVDYSHQYRADGIKWDTGETLDRAVVLAWREL